MHCIGDMDRQPFCEHHRDARLPIVAALAATVLFAGFCTGASQAPEAFVRPVLTAADDGRSIDLRAGSEVVIQLPENPSTGYRWEIDTDKVYISVERQRFEPQSDRVGGGGESSWVLRARTPGVTTVKLMLWRPWEGERAAIQRFVVTLRIAP